MNQSGQKQDLQHFGLIKHLTGVELGYLGDTFGRPFDDPPQWYPGSLEPNVDMWATPDESREQIVAMYQRACAHSDATIAALSLDATGRVRGWPPERSSVRRTRGAQSEPLSAAVIRGCSDLGSTGTSWVSVQSGDKIAA